MDNILVLQLNTNKISPERSQQIFMRLNDKLAMEFEEPPFVVVIPDGMSLLSYTLDELKSFRDNVSRVIDMIEENDE